MIRVLIADDHPVVRRGLRQIVEDEPDMNVGGEAANAEEARAQVHDDGRGVPREALRGPGSLGIVGMRERARACGGELGVRRLPRGGTRVHARLPMPPPSEAAADARPAVAAPGRAGNEASS